MNVPQIPGYYYDEERRKYFRIQPNHTVPQGSKYSKAEVTRREESAAKRQKHEDFEKRLVKETVRPSKVAGHPLLGRLGLLREMGQCGSRRIDHRDSRGEACVDLFQGLTLFDEGATPITHAERDPRSARLYASFNKPGPGSMVFYQPTSPEAPWNYPVASSAVNEMEMRECVTTFSISPGGYILEVSQPAYDASTVSLTVGALAAEPPSELPEYAFEGAVSRFSRPGWSNCNIASVVDGESIVFTVGCGEDLVTVSNAEAQWDLRTVKQFPSAIRAVDWLNRNVILAGSYDSRVWLYDTRSQGSTARFQHAHAVQALKKVDEYKVIAAGPKALSMYDLRYTSHRVAKRPQPTKPGHKAATPFMDFSDVECSMFRDVDLCRELGLVACASDLRTVQLFSLKSGKRLEPDSSMDSEELPVINRLVNTTRGHKLQNLRSYRYDSPLVSVKFENLPDRFDLLYDCDDEELDFTNGGGAGVPGLLVASMSVVDEWRL